MFHMRIIHDCALINGCFSDAICALGVCVFEGGNHNLF